MTELRDARLRRAMDAAPDAQLQPHARTREAIHAAAHGAVQSPWKRWWQRVRGGGSMPWAGAFATVAVATLVVALWEGQEVPGARPDHDRVAEAPAQAPARATIPAPAAPSTAPAEPEPVAPSGPAATTRPSVPPAQRSPAAPAVRRDAAPVPAPVPVPVPVPVPRPARPQDKAARPPPPPLLADEAPAAAEALARGSLQERRREPPAGTSDAAAPAGMAAAPAPPPAAAPAPPPAVAPAPAPSLAQRQAAPAAAAVRAAPTALPWSQVRIESGGRAVVVPRGQAGRLPALITSLLASPTDDAAPAAHGSLRLELGQGDEAAGVLERVGDRWRWTPVREGHQGRWLRPEPELATALDEEVGRLLRR